MVDGCSYRGPRIDFVSKNPSHLVTRITEIAQWVEFPEKKNAVGSALERSTAFLVTTRKTASLLDHADGQRVLVVLACLDLRESDDREDDSHNPRGKDQQ